MILKTNGVKKNYLNVLWMGQITDTFLSRVNSIFMIKGKATLSVNIAMWAAYLADEIWSYVRRVAELAEHLEVVDTANGVPELRQGVGACHPQRHVGSDMVKLRRDGQRTVVTMERNNVSKDGEFQREKKKLKLTFS